jgi:hypothetical protein
MPFPFTASHVDLGPARGPRLAMAWHMAEGGGTVGFLAKANPHGVSVHFVIEHSGRIVQMLALERMHTSIRIRNKNGTLALRSTDDPAGSPIGYGVTARRAVMGEWADVAATLGPNHATIGVEVEGFAAAGPNIAQRAAAAALAAEMHATFPALRGHLGHRDFNVKGCPGGLFPFAALGGHGLVGQVGHAEDDVKVTRNRWERWRAVNGNGVLRRNPVRTEVPFVRLTDGTEISSLAEATTVDGNNWRLVEHDGPAWLLRSDFEPVTPGGNAALDAALAAFVATGQP